VCLPRRNHPEIERAKVVHRSSVRQGHQHAPANGFVEIPACHCPAQPFSSRKFLAICLLAGGLEISVAGPDRRETCVSNGNVGIRNHSETSRSHMVKPPTPTASSPFRNALFHFASADCRCAQDIVASRLDGISNARMARAPCQRTSFRRPGSKA
jgi:hypothetical protein